MIASNNMTTLKEVLDSFKKNNNNNNNNINNNNNNNNYNNNNTSEETVITTRKRSASTTIYMDECVDIKATKVYILPNVSPPTIEYNNNMIPIVSKLKVIQK